MIPVKLYALIFVVLSCVIYGESLLLCPNNVKSFSIGANRQSYYICVTAGAVPILKKCPYQQVYWAAQEKCAVQVMNNGISESVTTNLGSKLSRNKRSIGTKATNQDLQTFSEPVLGRTVYLGCLYDATKSKIMSSDSFWSQKVITANKLRSVEASSQVTFFSAQSTLDRLSNMDIHASLKLGFLDGMISVEGSAAYLKDTVKSEDTISIVLKARYRTHSETLPTSTPTEYNDLCKLKGPTHVVTSIKYGLDAHFVFKKTKKADESKEKISGSLKIAVKSLPSIQIEGSADVKLDGELKKHVDDIDVNLFGDFVLDQQPTTYEESIGVFKNLKSHLGVEPHYSKASKMRMQLTPITRFCNAETVILLSISDSLLHSMTIMLDKIERTKLKANMIAKADPVHQYLRLTNIMNLFINNLSIFELEIKSKLQTILPSIRGGGSHSGEKDLIKLFTKYRTSAFYYDTAASFLKARKREVKSIQDILNVEKFKGTNVEVVDYEEANDNKILFQKQFVIMMVFHILPNMDVVHTFLKENEVDESKSWFNVPQIVTRMGKTFNSFMDFASANKNSKNRGYLVKLNNANTTFFNVYAQKEGEILSSNFQFPQLPPKITAITIRFDSITLMVNKPINKWIKYVEVKYWKLLRNESTLVKSLTFTSKNMNVEITELSPNEVYQFSMKYGTEMGTSLPGPESSIRTKPCSVPTNLKVKDMTATSYGILWEPPLYGIVDHIVAYEVTVNGVNYVKQKKITKKRYVVFGNLLPASTYNVSVEAVVSITQIHNGTKAQSEESLSLKSWLHVTTRPDTPSQPKLVAIAQHSLDINWNPPSKIAAGAIVYEYLVNYVKMNTLGEQTMVGSNMVQSSRKNTFISIKSLIMGTTYGVSVKIVTSQGSSTYSPVLIARTTYNNETELDKLRRTVEEEIKNSVLEATREVQAKIQRETSRLKQGIVSNTAVIRRYTGNIRSVRKGIGYLQAESKRLSDRVTMHQASITSLKKEHFVYYPKGTNKNVGKRYYSEYGARFIGYGLFGSHDTFYKANRGLTLVGCIELCYSKHQSDNSWNGLHYEFVFKDCICEKNDRGHTSSRFNLHYKF